MNKVRLIIGNKKDAELGKRVEGLKDFLNQVEKNMKLIRTKIYACENTQDKYKTSGCYLLEGSNRWLLSPPMISLYSLLIRVGLFHEAGKIFTETLENVKTKKIKAEMPGVSGSNDPTYLAQGEKGIDRIFKDGYATIFYKDIKKNYPQNLDVSTLHNNCGILGFTRESVKTYVPYWFKTEKKKKKKPAVEKT